VIEKIRNFEALESVQVIALTADTHPDTISDGLKAGFDQVLMKPLKMTQIVELAISTIAGLGS
jgi:DNA-binding response OmpR family regulator